MSINRTLTINLINVNIIKHMIAFVMELHLNLKHV